MVKILICPITDDSHFDQLVKVVMSASDFLIFPL